ncbi:uncharacterized protein LOC144114694 isoform X2 [Amblyomma americanum]
MQEYDLQLVGIVKDEPVFYSDSSKDGVFDANGSMKNEESEASIVGIGRDNQHTGSDAELTLDRATKQYREKCDAANLRTWSPNGLFPKLPSCVKPLLHGTPMSAERHKALLGRLRDEIIQFLNDHELIQDKNTSVKHRAYCALGRSLATRYPSMAWEYVRPGTESYSLQKNCWSAFMQRLSALRRAQKRRMMRKLQDAAATTSSTPAIPTTPGTATNPKMPTTPQISASLTTPTAPTMPSTPTTMPTPSMVQVVVIKQE